MPGCQFWSSFMFRFWSDFACSDSSASCPYFGVLSGHTQVFLIDRVSVMELCHGQILVDFGLIYVVDLCTRHLCKLSRGNHSYCSTRAFRLTFFWFWGHFAGHRVVSRGTGCCHHWCVSPRVLLFGMTCRTDRHDLFPEMARRDGYSSSNTILQPAAKCPKWSSRSKKPNMINPKM